MSGETPVPLPILWAQRKSDIFLTINVEVKHPTIKVEKESVYFKGVTVPNNIGYEETIFLYDTVVPESSSFIHKGRCIEMVLKREKEDEPYWPTLTKNKNPPNLKIDFNTLKDKHDEEEDDEDDNIDDINEKNCSAMGDVKRKSRSGYKTKMLPLDDEDDSDDEKLSDIEK